MNAGPTITGQPQSLSVAAGQGAQFTVTASGTGPLSYQWQFGGGVIAGATGSSYSIASAQAGNAGNYSVVVTNSWGGVTSSAAVLTVTVQPNGLVAAYGFNEGSGATVADGSGNGNTGTLSGATWTTSGKYGNGLVFNGGSLVKVPDSRSLDLTNAMTVEAWVYPTIKASGWSTAIMKEQSGEFCYVLYAGSPANQPNAYVYINGEQGFAGPSGLAVNAWSHLTATYDGTTLRLYVNGVLASTTAVSGAMAASSGVLRLGGNSVWGEWFSGLIDEVRVYNRALSQSEIQTDVNKPVG